ncbi:MAG: hypothetical protein CBC02_000370 [Flavobacteriaceae bacterium TMED42]|nr:MAG: hypothetical protein CBC02_000370 [Flavobacteriaceae bacterium TMED42]
MGHSDNSQAISAKPYKRKGRKGYLRIYINIYYGLKPNGKKDKYEMPVPVDYYENPSNDKERKHNDWALKYANELADEIMVDSRNGRHKRQDQKTKKIWLIQYMDKWAEKKYTKLNTLGAYISVRKHLRNFIGSEDIKLSSVNRKFCIDFFDHLKNTQINSKGGLSDSAIKGYMKKFKYFLKQLENEEIISKSPADGIKVGNAKSKPKEFLELSELETLINTECRFEELKRYFLFSCFSATAFAECKELEYQDFRQSDDGRWYLMTERIKTAKHTRLLMSHKAMEYILPLGNPTDKVFRFIKTSNRYDEIRRWIADSGIDKHITPHCAKNTFAVAYFRHHREKGSLTNDLMRYCQHSDWKTTERYLGKLLGSEYTTTLSPDFF